MLDFGFFTEKASWIHRNFKIRHHDEKLKIQILSLITQRVHKLQNIQKISKSSKSKNLTALIDFGQFVHL